MKPMFKIPETQKTFINLQIKLL